MLGNGPNMSFTPYERPVRAAFVGLGRIYDLNVRAYLDNPDVEVVALVDPSEERCAQRQADWPTARTFASAGELAASGLEVDTVEVLLPIPLHADGVAELLGYGWHVNLQKPICNDLADANRMLDAAAASGRLLRVMDNYLFYEPLMKLKEIVASGELGEVSGYHMKMVASGRGGWDVPGSTYEWQFQQMRRGRGTLVFDDGWHKLSTAIWLFGPIREVRAWVGTTEVIPGIDVDAPTTLVWEHLSGIRGVWDITLASTCTCAPTTTPTTNVGRSPAAVATRGSTGAPAAASSSRAWRSTSMGRCAPTTRSMTIGPVASEIPATTGCVGSIRVKARCCGVAKKPSTCCVLHWPHTRATLPAAPAWTRRRSSNPPVPRP